MSEKIPTQTNGRDLAGHRSGRLVAMRPTGVSDDGHILWECLCDCGQTRLVRSHSLVREKGGTKSCGCLRREVSSHPRKPWNAGKTYWIPGKDGERVYKHRHGWAKAAIAQRGNRCEQCGWDRAKCDVHHRTARRDRGGHVLSNAIVLCPNCHRIAHEQEAAREVRKPVRGDRGGERGVDAARVDSGRIQ